MSSKCGPGFGGIMQIYRDLYPQHYSWSTGTLGSGMVPQGSAIRIVAFTFHFVRNIYYTLYSSVYHGAGLGPHSPVVVTLEWKNCIMYSLPCDVQYMSFFFGGGRGGSRIVRIIPSVFLDSCRSFSLLCLIFGQCTGPISPLFVSGFVVLKYFFKRCNGGCMNNYSTKSTVRYAGYT
jgi:hypothetical protein